MLTDPDISHVADDELDRAIAERNEEMKAEADLSGISADEKRKKSALGHRDRVRERFLNTGLEGFADHEILELLLFYTIPRQDTKQIAHELIDRFDSVAGVFDADVEELCKTKGITQNSAVLFKLIPQLIGVYYSGKDEKKSYTNSDMLAELFKPMFVGESTEKFMLACFDSRLRRLSVTEISRGSSSCTTIDMRKIMSEVTKNGCTMAAIAHNHPKGAPRPSDEDVAVTRRINEIFRAVGVTLMDHIIVGESRTYSLRDGGELSIFD